MYSTTVRMYKLLALILAGLPLAAFSQATKPPMGIRNLALSSPAPVQRFAAPSLAIESNQRITGFTNCACQNGCGVLPVDLLSFEGSRLHEAQVLLYWRTANEMQNKGFEVQRSLGNTSHFEPVAFVPAQTSGALEYKYELPDDNNFTGISYYRLKQTDLDGNYVFSETIAIKGYSSQASLGLYPNPVTDKLMADIFSLKKTTAVIVLTDATQKTIYRQPVALNKGSNIIRLPVSRLSSGIYFVQLVSAESSMLSARFIKL